MSKHFYVESGASTVMAVRYVPKGLSSADIHNIISDYGYDNGSVYEERYDNTEKILITIRANKEEK
jgi:hypothetical protein